jgi:hypothetical protein
MRSGTGRIAFVAVASVAAAGWGAKKFGWKIPGING